MTDGNINDQTQFMPLLQQFAGRFMIDIMLGDAGFNASEHYEAVAFLGGRAFLDFDSDAKPNPAYPHRDQMFKLWKADDGSRLQPVRVVDGPPEVQHRDSVC